MQKKEIEQVYKVAKKSYDDAKGALMLVHKAVYERADSAISDVVPGYDADRLKFGNYTKDNFAVLFVDMRSSTKRAITIGAEQTFLSMHVFIPALLEVAKIYHGKVIDIMGDGIMVFFGGSRQIDNEMIKATAIKNAAYCSVGMLEVREKVINRILKEEGVGWPEIDYGIGVTYGDVVVTKIGINDVYDVKAFGNCVNKASKYSEGWNKIHISDEIKRGWPAKEGGSISFLRAKDGDGFYVDK